MRREETNLRTRQPSGLPAPEARRRRRCGECGAEPASGGGGAGKEKLPLERCASAPGPRPPAQSAVRSGSLALGSSEASREPLLLLLQRPGEPSPAPLAPAGARQLPAIDGAALLLSSAAKPLTLAAAAAGGPTHAACRMNRASFWGELRRELGSFSGELRRLLGGVGARLSGANRQKTTRPPAARVECRRRRASTRRQGADCKAACRQQHTPTPHLS